MIDGRNTWKCALETSLTLHTSKFVRIGLDLRKENGGSSTKKSYLTKIYERKKGGRESSSLIFDKENRGDEKYDQLWDEIRALRLEVVTLQGRIDALKEKETMRN